MPKPIVFIAALLLALPAFAQTRMPARQVEADTNMVNIAVSLPFTAQVALDWIDANWPAFSSESWSNIDPAEDTVQSVFDWVDDNWPAFSSESWSNIDPAEDTVQSVFDWVDDNWQAELDAEGWGYLSPEAPATVQGTFDWIDAYMGIDTNDWGYLAPTASTVQAAFTWLDDRFSGFDPEAVVMPGSNIVGGALISNQWTGLMPGTNITGFALNDETSSWDPIEATLAGYSMVPMFDVWSTNKQAGAAWVQVLASAYEVAVTNAPDSGFNPTTGIFTAPQVGYYYFVASGRFFVVSNEFVGLMLSDNSWTGPDSGPYTSSRYPHTGCSGEQSSRGWASKSVSLFKYMEANDTMCVWLHGSSAFTNWYKAFQGFALQ